ncbi:hypothetical protein D5086_021868 [Populus alba]|uniref:Uncharacterized protein n=1 Tax=Populus alba TaxID=43335 RepID=A0ACC4BDK4_POPAL
MRPLKKGSSLIMLLGHAGLLEEAENLIEMTHLGACIASSPSTIVERIAKKVMELKPNYLGRSCIETVESILAIFKCKSSWQFSRLKKSFKFSRYPQSPIISRIW